jgi:hypothetical protein
VQSQMENAAQEKHGRKQADTPLCRAGKSPSDDLLRR